MRFEGLTEVVDLVTNAAFGELDSRLPHRLTNNTYDAGNRPGPAGLPALVFTTMHNP